MVEKTSKSIGINGFNGKPENPSGRALNDPLCLLIVEDDSYSLLYLDFLLKKLGIQTIKARNAEVALSIINSVAIDGALLDISLGAGMTGLDLMAEMKGMEGLNSIPIIAVTAYEENSQNFIQKGFTDFLGKPYSLGDLEKKLKLNFEGKLLV